MYFAPEPMGLTTFVALFQAIEIGRFAYAGDLQQVPQLGFRELFAGFLDGFGLVVVPWLDARRSTKDCKFFR